jgi:hypothetical protein
MNDMMIMEVLHTAHDLMDVVAALVIGDHFSALMQLHHRSLLAELQDDVDIERVVKEAMEPNDIFVI